MATFLYVVYSSLLSWLAGTNEYCETKCPGNIHVRCEDGLAVSHDVPTYNAGVWVPKVYLEKSEVEEILNYHNEKRRFVASGNETRGKNGPQPAALEMPELEWDNELAALAQQLANQVTKWETYVCSHTKRFKVGQSVAHHTENSQGWIPMGSLLDEWYNEVDHFDAKNVGNYKFDGSTRRYAQIVSARTTKIGCGYTKSIWKIGQAKHKEVKTHHRLVCNYGPDGLVNGQPLYQAKH